MGLATSTYFSNIVRSSYIIAKILNNNINLLDFIKRLESYQYMTRGLTLWQLMVLVTNIPLSTFLSIF